MKRSTPWIFVLSLLLAVFWLSACTAETSPNADTANSTPENSAELTKETAEPALSPVTRTAQPSPQATKDTASSTSDVQDATTLDRAEVDMGDAVLVFQRTGGLMGVRSNDQIWYFYPDGRVTVSDGRSWQVKPEEIDALMNDIQPAQFATLEASYMPEDTCCDRFTYTIAVKDGSDVYQTTTMDGADAPPEVFEAIDAINAFILTLPA